jgi:hypothetical protein
VASWLVRARVARGQIGLVRLYCTVAVAYVADGGKVPQPKLGTNPKPLTPRSRSVLMPGMTEWGELSFKVVRLEKAGQELLARAGNIMVARAAFDVSVSLYQTDEIELRQGSRVICSSKREPE